jgi:hypothetical protein
LRDLCWILPHGYDSFWAIKLDERVFILANDANEVYDECSNSDGILKA